VGDGVLPAQECLEVGADRMTILARCDQDVRRGGGQARGDLPDMQVMDFGDVRPARHRHADGGRIQPGGRGLEEDPPGLLDQPGACPQHQRHHHQRGDRVGPGEPGQHDDQARQRGGGERVQVGEDVPERAGQVEAPRMVRVGLAARLGDQQGGRDVDGHAHQRDSEHRPAGHGRGSHQPADGRVTEPDREQHQRDAVGLRGHDLGALEPVGVSARRRPGGQPCREQHERDGGRVGQHVRGIGDQRERVRG
jgi:hypothetical protein